MTNYLIVRCCSCGGGREYLGRVIQVERLERGVGFCPHCGKSYPDRQLIITRDGVRYLLAWIIRMPRADENETKELFSPLKLKGE